MFGTDQIEELIAKAVQLNAQPMCNVYVGAALRKPDTPRDERASDGGRAGTDGILLRSGQARRCGDGQGKVCARQADTGRGDRPRTRTCGRNSGGGSAEPITDKAAWQALLKGMAHAMGGDTSVTDPPRVMRLAGSIAWPIKAGRTVEMTLGRAAEKPRPGVLHVRASGRGVSTGATAPSGSAAAATASSVPRTPSALTTRSRTAASGTC